jgi:carbamoyl-phosphate synthase large subunit
MYKILVTGVGAIIGYGVIKSLRALAYPVKIIGIDIYSDAIGQHWCDHFAVATPTAAPEYINFINSIVEQYQIDLIIPGIEQDSLRLSRDRNLIDTSKCSIALNSAELVELAKDKWLLHQKLLQAGLPTIKTLINANFRQLADELKLPFLFKPRNSYATKGIQKIYNENDLIYWLSKYPNNYILQEIVGDDEAEYTVGTFGLGDGSCLQKIIFQRKLSGEGATSKAKVCLIPELENLVDQLCLLFNPVGPTNLQFRYHQGQYLLLEINPRISSSTSLRTAFGYNEAQMCIEYYLKGKIPSDVGIRSGCAARFIEDLIIL